MKIVKPFWRDAGVRQLGSDAAKLSVAAVVIGGVIYYGDDVARWFLKTPAGDWISKKISRVVG